jgi:hypothetical protein
VLGRVDQGFADISAIALNAAIIGSSFGEHEAYFVVTMVLPFGLTYASAIRPATDTLLQWYSTFRLAVLITRTNSALRRSTAYAAQLSKVRKQVADHNEARKRCDLQRTP